jgi:methyl-accepting chemotaxis protein
MNDVDGAAIRWLDSIRASGDFSVSFPLVPNDPHDAQIVAAVSYVASSFARELRGFATLIEEASGAVDRNERQLAAARVASDRYQALVTKAAELFSEMEAASAKAAEQTRELELDARSAETASHSASAQLHAEGESGGTAGLVAAIGTVEVASKTLRTTSQALVSFVGGVARIARQAALLSTNARIEAAHLGQDGRGFAIVANEVRSLAESTKEAVIDIGAIARGLVDSTQRAAGSTSRALEASRSLEAAEAQITTIVSAIEGRVAEFVQPVADIAAIAEQQQRALPLLLERFSSVTECAQAVATSAREASELDLMTTFKRAQSRLHAYRLSARDPAQPQVTDELAKAIVEVAVGRTHALSGHTEPLAQSVELFAMTFAEVERSTLAAVIEAAVAIGRNSFLWRGIASRIGELKEALDLSRGTLVESREAARALVDAAATMRDFSNHLRDQTAAAISTLGLSVQSLDRVREQVNLVTGVVGEMSKALERASTILSVVDEISAETNLLALNAAIEAAHAGKAGLGFSVIAGEIRKLADSTHIATSQVSETMAFIGSAGEDIRNGTENSSSLTQRVEDRARAAESAVRELIARMNEALDRSLELGGVAQQEMRSYDGLIGELNAALETIDQNVAAATDVRRLELAEVGAQAFSICANRNLEIFAETLRGMAFTMSTEMDAVFNSALASGKITTTDLRDTAYERITGARVADLSRLFDVSKVPPQGFDPPKFSTRYDRFVEEGINALIDRYVPLHPAVKAMFAVDLNGYCFGHYRECRQDWTGNHVTDLNNNRIKRFFEDALSLRCSRVGLGAAARELPGRTSYQAFEAAGCVLRRQPGPRPWAIYTYARDTGLVYNDLSLGLFANDMRVGTIRIIYDPDVL